MDTCIPTISSYSSVVTKPGAPVTSIQALHIYLSACTLDPSSPVASCLSTVPPNSSFVSAVSSSSFSASSSSSSSSSASSPPSSPLSASSSDPSEPCTISHLYYTPTHTPRTSPPPLRTNFSTGAVKAPGVATKKKYKPVAVKVKPIAAELPMTAFFIKYSCTNSLLTTQQFVMTLTTHIFLI